MKKYIIGIVLTACLITAMNGCKADKEQTAPPVQKGENNQEQQISLSQEQEIIQEPEAEKNYTNPLTGEKTAENFEDARPVAIMINNIKESLPQIGISEADIVYEVLEEGGITRLLCIYSDYSSINEIGSVRSSRDYFIDLADAHDAIYVHAGGSTYAYAELANRKTNNLDGLYLDSFYRSPERKKTMATEHTLMTSGKGLYSSIINKGYRTTSSSQSPLSFDEAYTLGSNTASYIKIPFSIGYKANPYAVSFFNYDDQNNVYLKGHYENSHIDGDDSAQLSFKNVITLTCPMNAIAGDELGCIQVHFYGQGTGTFNVDGTSREIVWKKADRQSQYSLYESDGTTPLKLAPGKSYIALVPTGTNLTIN